MRTARFVGPHFLDLPYQRRTYHGEEEEEKERKEVIDPIGSFPLRNTRGTPWRTGAANARCSSSAKQKKGRCLRRPFFVAVAGFSLVAPALRGRPRLAPAQRRKRRRPPQRSTTTLAPTRTRS